jgi:hypothetical protein
MGTMKLTKSAPLKQDEKCWGCKEILPKGSQPIMHLENKKGDDGKMQVLKSYWCPCCVAFSEKFSSSYNEIDEGQFAENPLYKRFRTDWEKENKNSNNLKNSDK